MKTDGLRQFDINIARTRVAMSLLAMISLYVDPTTAGGLFHLDRYALAALILHLVYSVAMVVALRFDASAQRLVTAAIVLDLGFAAAVARLTEGQTSPSYVFFVFAIVAAGIRGGLARTIAVTALSVLLYLGLIASAQAIGGAYVMRAVYLAIAGSLVAFFGRYRAQFEARLRELETRTERESIARSLHDGYVQALSGINLRLQTTRELLARGAAADAARHLNELQLSVTREYDEVREYLHSLAGLNRASSETALPDLPDPDLVLDISLTARAMLGEQILQIMLEGLRNASRHARARMVRIEARRSGSDVHLSMADDGIGFAPSADVPWAIASRANELGGTVALGGDGSATIEVVIPIDDRV
jgi:signal transduction histidine kinase